MTEPQMLGKYQIIEEIGRGGFATVYRALDTILEREVALKVLKPGWTDDAKAVERFMREARAASRLDHSGIVTIYDVGSADSRLFIAMKLLAGQSLDHLIKANGPLSWQRTLNIVQQVAEALDYAHSKGLVHRDIKPSNIIVGEADRAVLTDFGLVRGAEQASLSTGSTGGILGTPEYIPPEVWEGQTATKASDIYALACVVHEMLIGRPLFAADTGAAVMRKHVLVGPEFPANWPPDVPNDVATVLRKALEREQNQRYSTASEFAVGLRECASHAAKAQQATEQEAQRKQLEAEEVSRKAREETARKIREEQELEATRIAAEAAVLATRRKQEEATRKLREEQETERLRLTQEDTKTLRNSSLKEEGGQSQPQSGIPLWAVITIGIGLVIVLVSVISSNNSLTGSNQQLPKQPTAVVVPSSLTRQAIPTATSLPTELPIIAPPTKVSKPTQIPATVAPAVNEFHNFRLTDETTWYLHPRVDFTYIGDHGPEVQFAAYALPEVPDVKTSGWGSSDTSLATRYANGIVRGTTDLAISNFGAGTYTTEQVKICMESLGGAEKFYCQVYNYPKTWGPK